LDAETADDAEHAENNKRATTIFQKIVTALSQLQRFQRFQRIQRPTQLVPAERPNEAQGNRAGATTRGSSFLSPDTLFASLVEYPSSGVIQSQQ
jgi:hypothetical protein